MTTTTTDTYLQWKEEQLGCLGGEVYGKSQTSELQGSPVGKGEDT
jgi:hypothetical protein